jgi:hypothetical protein
MPSGRNDSFASAFSHLPRENWQSIELIPFEKNFYREHAAVSARSDADVQEFRQKNQMSMIGHGIPKPVHSFLEASFPDYIVRTLQKQGFTDPTAIQAQVSTKGSIANSIIAFLGMAHGNVWTRHGWNCSNWFRQDFGLPPASHCSHQRSTTSSPWRRSSCFDLGTDA